MGGMGVGVRYIEPILIVLSVLTFSPQRGVLRSGCADLMFVLRVRER